MGNRDATTDTYNRRNPIDWKGVVVWVVGSSATCGVALAVWAHGTLWSHDTRLTQVESKVPTVERKIDDHEIRDSRKWDKLDDTLIRFETKLDAMRDKIDQRK
jgi:hypothetical protein